VGEGGVKFWEQIDVQEDRFSFEQEITVKISKNSWRVYEVPISYFGCNYAEGREENHLERWGSGHLVHSSL
jgi:hypothetical protein